MSRIKTILIVVLLLLRVSVFSQPIDSLKFKSFLFEFGGGMTVSKRNMDVDNNYYIYNERYGTGYLININIHHFFTDRIGIGGK